MATQKKKLALSCISTLVMKKKKKKLAMKPLIWSMFLVCGSIISSSYFSNFCHDFDIATTCKSVHVPVSRK